MRVAVAKAKTLRSFPMEGVTCRACGQENCLMYPDPGKDEWAGGVCRPTTVCPHCSTSANESYLRFAAERQGFRLSSATVFVPPRPAPIAEFQAKLDEADDPSIVEALEGCWRATEDGTDYTSEFERGDDGRLIFYDDGPRPSFALALFFDWERHLRDESTALDWTQRSN